VRLWVKKGDLRRLGEDGIEIGVKLILGGGKDGLILGEAEDCIIDGFGTCVAWVS